MQLHVFVLALPRAGAALSRCPPPDLFAVPFGVNYTIVDKSLEKCCVGVIVKAASEHAFMPHNARNTWAKAKWGA